MHAQQDINPAQIPVGGVVAAEKAIHPGMHSSDICCSMAVSIFSDRDINPTAILDAGMKLSHFGGGGRPPEHRPAQPPAEVMDAFARNPFLTRVQQAALEHFATQGDGNHFFYVGRVHSSGDFALVTHHGSRKPGAMLYKAGMLAAERIRQAISPEDARPQRLDYCRYRRRGLPTGRPCKPFAPGPRPITLPSTI